MRITGRHILDAVHELGLEDKEIASMSCNDGMSWQIRIELLKDEYPDADEVRYTDLVYDIVLDKELTFDPSMKWVESNGFWYCRYVDVWIN